jgi:hypothetical protein
MKMFRLVVFLIVFLGILPAQADSGQIAQFKQDSIVLTRLLDDAVSTIVPGPILQRSKATYLDGYGVVMSIEVALETPRNPFSGVRAPAEVRQLSAQRRTALKEKAVELLKDKVGGLDSVAPDEWVAIVIHMLNTNPADLPDLPTQLVVAAKKQDVVDLGSGTIAPDVFRDRIRIREH